MNETNNKYNNSSFRDPSGYIIEENDKIFRIILPSYFEIYNYLKNTNFFDKFIEKRLLIPHKEIEANKNNIIIQAEKVPFLSFPYEWSFSQLKSAAILTLKIQYESIKQGITLKDASAYNIQFIGKNPIFIDTTSFELYKEGQPWTAYKQFCEHFLAPLLLMKHRDTKFSKILSNYIDGIPLLLTSKTLPFKTYFNSLCLLHIHSHSKKIKKYENNFSALKQSAFIPKHKLLNIIEHLYEQIEKLNIDKKSNWNDYYKNCSYNEKALTEKVNFVKNSINNTTPGYILDIGCNEGFFSNVVKNKSSYIIAIDNDELVIERLYNNLNSDDNILPLIVDITNPSPSIGWENKERISFIKRIGTNNTTIALALIHHLRIFYNIPLENIAKFFAKFSKQLIIEFVPKTDVQTQKLLQNKADTYNDYTEENFVLCFTKYFTITEILHNNGRILYNMNRK